MGRGDPFLFLCGLERAEPYIGGIKRRFKPLRSLPPCGGGQEGGSVASAAERDFCSPPPNPPHQGEGYSPGACNDRYASRRTSRRPRVTVSRMSPAKKQSTATMVIPVTRIAVGNRGTRPVAR